MRHRAPHAKPPTRVHTRRADPQPTIVCLRARDLRYIRIMKIYAKLKERMEEERNPKKRFTKDSGPGTKRWHRGRGVDWGW